MLAILCRQLSQTQQNGHTKGVVTGAETKMRYGFPLTGWSVHWNAQPVGSKDQH